MLSKNYAYTFFNLIIRMYFIKNFSYNYQKTNNLLVTVFIQFKFYMIKSFAKTTNRGTYFTFVVVLLQPLY